MHFLLIFFFKKKILKNEIEWCMLVRLTGWLAIDKYVLLCYVKIGICWIEYEDEDVDQEDDC